jgi:hypothetical protein
MRALVLAVLAAGAALAAAFTEPAEAKEGKQGSTLSQLASIDQGIVRKIHRYQRKTWHYQLVMDKPRTLTDHSAHRTDVGRAYRLWVLKRWRRRTRVVARQFARPQHYAAWRCIHRYEGDWHDPNAPYWGGLQMDLSFQRAYGAYLLRLKGTADRWTPLEQMWVAERAARSRGFTPWFNTARLCGLV